eukprot:scaffold185935_cov28-Tisochrysis_lutea.AAC.1
MECGVLHKKVTFIISQPCFAYRQPFFGTTSHCPSWPGNYSIKNIFKTIMAVPPSVYTFQCRHQHFNTSCPGMLYPH